jgi:hypothetical protein
MRHSTIRSLRRQLAVCGVALAALGAANVAVHAQGPEEKRAIQRGVDFLRGHLKPNNGAYSAGGAQCLAAYAMLKGGVKPTDPAVAGTIAALLKRLRASKGYSSYGNGIYAAGCELMLLEAATPPGKPALYRKEMQHVVDYIIKNQNPKGYWNYLGGDEHGDASVTQYGILGLWAAERVGIDVPKAAYDKTAAWLIYANQGKTTGGFRYRPTNDVAGETLSMAAAGVSTVLICQRYLYPNQSAGLRTKKPQPKKRGVVETVDIDTEISKQKPARKKVKTDYRPTIGFSTLSGSAARGLGWITANYRLGEWPYYTLYGIERTAALGRVRTIGNHDWYAEGSDWLLKNQQKDGSWSSRRAGIGPATSFAILFLSRSTSKILGEPPLDLLGDGLLRGDRGFPTDLSTIEEGQGGAIKKRTSLGPIDDLLNELQNPEKLDVPEVQKAIVEKIQLGSGKERKKWLEPGRRKQLLRMANHKRPDVRAVAVWALGRTGNIDAASVLMDALQNDPDLDVAVEARNALCWLARKPNGFGMPEKPNVPDGATQAQRLRAAEEWRKATVAAWKKWYFQVRPYRERDDLKETGAPAK